MERPEDRVLNSSKLALDNIKETCLYVQDLDKTAHFYHHLLGLPIIDRSDGRHIFFRIGEMVLLCFIAETTRHEKRFPAHYAEGKQHMAFGVKKEAYQDWKDKIQRLEITITCEYEWREGVKSFYFDDPDGHVLEIVPEGLWEE